MYLHCTLSECHAAGWMWRPHSDSNTSGDEAKVGFDDPEEYPPKLGQLLAALHISIVQKCPHLSTLLTLAPQQTKGVTSQLTSASNQPLTETSHRCPKALHLKTLTRAQSGFSRTSRLGMMRMREGSWHCKYRNGRTYRWVSEFHKILPPPLHSASAPLQFTPSFWRYRKRQFNPYLQKTCSKSQFYASTR